MKQKFIIGIDEVGRGALAGPVVVVAAAVAVNSKLQAPNSKLLLRDSKKLSAKQREAWFAYFKTNPNISFAVARVYPRGIERLNISGAANLAALRAYKRLATRVWGIGNAGRVYLDGGLYLGKKGSLTTFGVTKNAQTIIKADEKITAVKIASIIAKVHRDRFMIKLARRYPDYSFEVHKGYGTKLHRAALAKVGPCEIHRRSFLFKQ